MRGVGGLGGFGGVGGGVWGLGLRVQRYWWGVVAQRGGGEELGL